MVLLLLVWRNHCVVCCVMYFDKYTVDVVFCRKLLLLVILSVFVLFFVDPWDVRLSLISCQATHPKR